MADFEGAWEDLYFLSEEGAEEYLYGQGLWDREQRRSRRMGAARKPYAPYTSARKEGKQR